MNDIGIGLLGLIGLALMVFLVLREFWCWYWMQSEQVALLKQIARSVQLLEERDRPLPPGVVPPAASPYATPPWAQR